MAPTGSANDALCSPETDASNPFDRAVERSTGQSIDELRRTPLDEHRRNTEQRLGRVLRFVSWFPLVGRGNVMRDRLVTREEIERDLDELLGT